MPNNLADSTIGDGFLVELAATSIGIGVEQSLISQSLLGCWMLWIPNSLTLDFI